jgi:cell wall assembly regulator SMI1
MTKKGSAAKPRGSDLARLLAALEPLVTAKRPDLCASLAPPADAGTLRSLEETLSSSHSLPTELRHWFGWHDGQRTDVSFSEEDVYFLHSVESALATWRLLADGAHRYKKTWLPLFQNGAGDHRAYDLETGSIIGFFHDDEDRPIEWDSLTQWAKAMQRELKAATKTSAVTASLENLAWNLVPAAPARADISGAPRGTLYFIDWRALDRSFPQVFLKTGDNTWLAGRVAEKSTSLDSLRSHLQTKPSKSSGYWKEDFDVWHVASRSARIETAKTELSDTR